MLLLAVAAGTIVMILLGWLPIGGPLLAGILAGLLTFNGIGRGALAGFLSGLIASPVISYLSELIAQSEWSAFNLVKSLTLLIGFPVIESYADLVALAVYLSVFGLVGGAIGSAMKEAV